MREMVVENIEAIASAIGVGALALVATIVPVWIKIKKIITDTKEKIENSIKEQKAASTEKHTATFELIKHNCDFQQAKLKEIIEEVSSIKVNSTQAEKLLAKQEEDIDLAQDEAFQAHCKIAVLEATIEDLQAELYEASEKKSKTKKK